MTKQNETNPNKATNMVLIGMTAGALLLGAYNAGVNSGLIPTSNQTKTEALMRQNQAQMKQMTVKMAQMNAISTKKTAEMVKESMADANDSNRQINYSDDGKTVTEQFQITEIGDNILGEPVYGTGEGINYPAQKFWDSGLDSINIGDIVQVAWSREDYENSNWDKVEFIKFISAYDFDPNTDTHN
jgi:hypothetical protein